MDTFYIDIGWCIYLNQNTELKDPNTWYNKIPEIIKTSPKAIWFYNFVLTFKTFESGFKNINQYYWSKKSSTFHFQVTLDDV